MTKEALIKAGCTSPDGTFVHASTNQVIAATTGPTDYSQFHAVGEDIKALKAEIERLRAELEATKAKLRIALSTEWSRHHV